MTKRFTALEYLLLICFPIALLSLTAPFLYIGYKFLKIHNGMGAYEAKLVCNSGRFSRSYYENGKIIYMCRGVIFGVVYLIGLPLGEKWQYTCVMELEFVKGKVSAKRFLPFAIE